MKIIEIAKKDIGKKEKPGNTGFEDPLHEKKLRAVNWQPGWAWCSSQIEAWMREAHPDRAEELNGYFVPSAVATFRNLKNAGYHVSMKPSVGAFVFWQRIKEGVPLWMGHAGVVSMVISDTEFLSIEGNTNEAGSREGTTVLEKSRTVKNDVENGLQVIGFVTI